jgi:hypothetical protein
MKIISFDVGIKNMAYCVLSVEPTTPKTFNIIDWNVITLMESESAPLKCTCTNPAKSKKKQPTPCSKKANYQKDGKYYCEKHASSPDAPFIIPLKDESPMSLKKKKKEELAAMCRKYELEVVVDGGCAAPQKDDLLNSLGEFFKRRCFEPLLKKRTQTADEVNLIEIGKSMKRQLDAVESIHTGITHVVIENQISPIATRMKTIQGMLAQYFIMRYGGGGGGGSGSGSGSGGTAEPHIEFVSSSNKLKLFRAPPPAAAASASATPSSYKANKQDSVKYCSQIIQQNSLLETWRTCLEVKKKDDYADCFLQGLWYMNSKNILKIAEDLKIIVL